MKDLDKSMQIETTTAEGLKRAYKITVDADVPTGVVAFVGGRVITAADDPTASGATGGVIENGTIVVEGNRIVAVGPTADVTVPGNAHVVDVSGTFLDRPGPFAPPVERPGHRMLAAIIETPDANYFIKRRD